MICVLLLAIAMSCMAPVTALAHLAPNSVISLDFRRHDIEAEVLVPAGELAYAEGRSLNLRDGLASERAFLTDYVTQRLRLTAIDGRVWRTAVDSLELRVDGGGADVVANLRLTPPPRASVRRFTLHWDGVIDRLANHYVLVFARSDFYGGVLASSPELVGGLQGARRTVAVDRGAANAWRGLAASFQLGMAHIAEGHDHLLFLIALVLPAPLRAGGRRWREFGGWRRMLTKLAVVASAFTVGHSLTLEQNPTRLNRGDSHGTRMLIHASCWAEASMDGEISVEGSARAGDRGG